MRMSGSSELLLFRLNKNSMFLLNELWVRVQSVWACVNTAIKLRCGPNNWTETCQKKRSHTTLVKFIGGINMI